MSNTEALKTIDEIKSALKIVENMDKIGLKMDKGELFALVYDKLETLEIISMETTKPIIKYRKKQPDEQITLSLHNMHEGRLSVGLIFRRGIESKITSTGYIKLILSKDKLYMIESSRGDGYKITRKSTTENGYMKIYVTTQDAFEKFEGDHFLEYDEVNDRYYIGVKNE